MKKTLAIVLALLVAFSMFAVAASATSETTDTTTDATAELVTVNFVYVTDKEANVIQTIHVKTGTSLVEEKLVPDVPKEFTRVVKDDDGSEYELDYTFTGWKSSVGGVVYHSAQVPTVIEVAGSVITYTAEYSIQKVEETQSFWQFIASLFARMNILFEYFARIFNF